VIKTTLKSIRGHLGRLVATAAAVILGISFLAGTLIFTDSVQKAFDDLFATVFETTDAQIRSTETINAGFGFEVRGRISETVLADVRAVEGVAAAEGFVQGTATVIDSQGDPIGNPGQGPPTFGFSWSDDAELNQFTISQGRSPAGPGEVVLDANTTEVGGYAVGDSVTVLATSGSESFELVGVAKFGESNSLGGATTALFELRVAQRLMEAEGQLDAVSVRGEVGVSQQALVDAISPVLGDGVEAITGAEATADSQDQIATALTFINVFLLAFAGIALFVSAFVIYNTFAILIAQRTQELALLRAIGASRLQVVGSVFLEALIVGLVGSALGVLFGVLLSNGLSAMLDAFGVDLPSGGLVVGSSTILVSLIVGTMVTLVSAVFPAVSASRIAPLEAMRQSAAEAPKPSKARLAIGAGMVVLGGIALLVGLLQPRLDLAGGGVAAMFIGVFVLGPAIARPVARLLGAPIARTRGVTGKMARENAMRNPKRTARTAAALTIGVALVAGVTVLASSLATSIEDVVGQQFVGDVVIDSGSFGPGGGFSPDLTRQIGELDQVETVASLRVGLAEINGDGDFIVIVDPAVVFELVDPGLLEGQPADLTETSIFLLDTKADALGVGLGDTLSLRFLDGVIRTLAVAGVYEEQAFFGNYTISQGLYESTGAEQLEFVAYVQLADGASVSDATRAIDERAAAYPNVTVQDRQEYIESQSAQLDQMLGLIYGLLGLALIIAAFGIANTLRLSVIERTREIGLMRAVGMTRGQVRSTIRWEAVITSLFGALLGIVLGLFFGYAIIYALRDQGVSSFSVPVVPLAVVVLLAAVIGVLSSLLPARRAAKQNILDAIG